MINDNIIKGQWKVIKGEAKRFWGRLTDDELEQTQGQIDRMEGLLQRKMGYQEEEAKTELRNFLSRFDRDEPFTDVPSEAKENRPYNEVKLEEEIGIETIGIKKNY